MTVPRGDSSPDTPKGGAPASAPRAHVSQVERSLPEGAPGLPRQSTPGGAGQSEESGFASGARPSLSQNQEGENPLHLTPEFPAYLHGFAFSGLVGEVSALTPEEVIPALKFIEERVAAGLHAAGYLSYEGAGALNGDLTTHAPQGLPLLWFGLYQERSCTPFPAWSHHFETSHWQASLDQDQFAAAIASIRELIAAGDCYQVNFTMRQSFSFSGCPRSFFSALRRSQPTPYCSYLETGNHRILSASPELFFSLAGGVLTTRPMKGTSSRGRWFEEDQVQKLWLRESPKELAENLMIVDLLRNDMGMVSETGSVQVNSLFDVETHPTVHQMTSTIESRVKQGVGVPELLQALFPCGSVTGAPKRRSMQIIAELEGAPRGLYTGCIGYFSPGGEAKFSVAIRTAVIDMASGRGEIGIGSGITYDSAARDEYAECLSKGRFAREKARDFHLIESLLYDGGYFLLERHLERLAQSARYFSFSLHPAAARSALEAIIPTLCGRQKVRLLLFPDGKMHCESAPIADPDPALEATVCCARGTVDSSDRFLYHKTSLRRLYAREAAARPDVTEVIFLNERGEVTEGVNSNIVMRLDGKLFTPAIESGLLPGVFRAELLESGAIEERVLTRRDLERAEEISLINSVRKWRRVKLVP
jgi:para-aminobenzoate synthetase/4-amino-4-deoxychorismate lyase